MLVRVQILLLLLVFNDAGDCGWHPVLDTRVLDTHSIDSVNAVAELEAKSPRNLL